MEDKLIMSFDEISSKNENMQINDGNYSKLANIAEYFCNYFNDTYITDVIYENCSEFNVEGPMSIFDKSQTIKNSHTLLTTFLQRTKYDWKIETLRKIEPG